MTGLFEDNHEVVELVHNYCDRKRVSMQTVALSTGITLKTLEEIMAGKEPEGYAECMSAIREWVMPKAYPEKLNVVPTPTFKRLTELLREAYFERVMYIIEGKSGYGKTLACKYMELTEPNVYYVSARVKQGSKDLFMSILSAMGYGEYPLMRIYVQQNKVIEHFRTRAGLLIVDEADKLRNDVWDNLREIHDETKSMGLVFIGEEHIERKLLSPDKDQRRLTRVIRRTEDVVTIDALSKKDIRVFMEQKVGTIGGDMLKLIGDKAIEFGGFGLLEKVCRRIDKRRARGEDLSGPGQTGNDVRKCEVGDAALITILSTLKEYRYGIH